jgi:endonuclease YncB( thermonuclease family)
MLRRIRTNLAAILRFTWRVDSLTGHARVIDGDTVVVAGELMRLHGIDAPELDQTFWWRGEQVACGMMAMAALETLAASVELRCEPVERDRHGRLVAKCFAPDRVDIGRRLVAAGWALAYRRYSKDYVDAENEARKARRGIGGEPSSSPGSGAHRLPRAPRRARGAPIREAYGMQCRRVSAFPFVLGTNGRRSRRCEHPLAMRKRAFGRPWPRVQNTFGSSDRD